MRLFLPAALRFAWMLLAASAVLAPSPLLADSQSLNQNAIHSKYKEKDFLAVIRMLETFVSDHKSFGRGDSIFIAKHLAATYIANPETRERGRFFMAKLLELS